ncbi:peptidase [Nocardiopsis gilva YIM 90087]|uniref:Peptidase n=1 Tax=Nocardiopsis gilva YIM 90087 TaxID=1235441 RepID=A0A223S229_9ACTN|nr:peptidase [Nocardiopsis gilva YIM 90087]
MAQTRARTRLSDGRVRDARRYELPEYARRTRRRLNPAVTMVLLTGLSAIGLAGFVSVSAMFSDPGRPTAGGGAAAGSGVASRGPDVLTDNPLYEGERLTEVTCPAPELDPDDPESMAAFLHEITDCLDKAWSEEFAETDMAFERPTRVYWYASGQSPCGNFPAEGTAAFYCQANKGLYLGVEDIVRNSGDNRHPEAYTFLLSHEYAHHVQGEAGILTYFHSARGGKDSAQDRHLMTRRSELQANCLGGTFLGAIGDTFPITDRAHANILKDAERRGDYSTDDRTHGSPENGGMWTAHGMDRGDPAACNTWIAREDLVE